MQLQQQNSASKLPPIPRSRQNTSTSGMSNMQGTNYSQVSSSSKNQALSPTKQQRSALNGGNLLGEYEKELERLREENNQIRFAKDLRERDFENVMFENAQLQNKLENLENVFIGSSIARDGKGEQVNAGRNVTNGAPKEGLQ